MGVSSSNEVVAVSDLESEEDRKLCYKAAEASRAAYAPYSGFSVGAAVRTREKNIYSGANLENASYGVGMCAEVAAITAANSAGDFDIEAIALVGYPTEDRSKGFAIVTPCGRCRQIILEASQVSGIDIKVIACNGELSRCRPYTISELLLDGFGPANLKVDVTGYHDKHRTETAKRAKRA